MADEANASDGDMAGSSQSELRKERSLDKSIHTTGTRSSKEGDGNDSDGGKSMKGSGRFGRLLKRNKRSKQLKDEDSNDSNAAGDDAVRGRQTNTNNASRTALGLPPTPGGERSSVTTTDSEDETAISPPPLVSRSSHKDYLVATSPRVAASTTTTITAGSQSSSHTVSHASTLPSEHPFNPKPRQGLHHGWTMASSLGVDSPSRDSSRSISPGSRLKGAFKSRKTSPSKDNPSERQSRPGTREGEPRPQSQPVPKRPMTGGSTSSLPLSMTSHMTDDSVPPVPPIPASPPQIALNGAGLASKPSLNSIMISSGEGSKTPALMATPPTPVIGIDDSAPRTPPFRSSKPGSPVSLSGHRRTRSDSASKLPSKLSQSMSSPLTPTMEEPPGSRGRNISQGSAGSGGGFFTSVFSAAQNMTTTLANMGGNNRPRGATTGSGAGSIPEEKEEAEAEGTHAAGEKVDAEEEPPKPLAIDTMGSGNLSLSHLGITTESPQVMAPSASLRARSGTQVRHEEHAAKMEDASAAEAVSAAYSLPAPINGVDRPATAVAEDTTLGIDRPPSQSGSLAARTPPNGSMYDGDSGIRRTGSIRDKLGSKRRKKRNSSGTTIGAAIAASQTAIASPSRSSGNAKLEGFTYANRKRDKDYHQLFRSVPEDDHLLDDYSCALQRDIILAGRIYVSEGHICFSSNILGWVTNLIISFDEIVAIDKESTAMVFPNAIAIQTLHARHTFRSLLSREATYDLMVSIWKTNHPNLQSTETGTKLLSGAEAIAAEAERGSDEEDEDDSEDDSDDDDADSMDSRAASATPSDNPAAPASPQRKVSQMVQEAATAAAQGPTVGGSQAAAAASSAAAAADKDFPGPATHAATECADGAAHYENLLKDNDLIPAPLGKVYSMVFGPASGGFMSRWLIDEAKCWDMEVTGGGQLKTLDNDNKSRTFSYMKPLYGAIGPKQTKCIVKEDLDAFDLEKAVSVTVTTQTPDVPSGNVFASKTRYCLAWAPNNQTKIHMSFFTEWSGKSWIKGPIEKGSKDGQQQYADDLVKALRAGVSSGSRARAGSKGKKSKKGKKGDANAAGDSSPVASKGDPRKKEEDWGLLEPLRPILGPVVDPVKPLFSARMLCVFLLFLLTISWFRNSRTRAGTRPVDLVSGPHFGGLSAYEEAWRTEEEALWKWLEERVGTKDGVPIINGNKKNADTSKIARKARQQVLRGRGNSDSMSVREIEHALRITKEKLGKLERAVGVHVEEPAGKESEAQQV